jgi:hypothetical protein
MKTDIKNFPRGLDEKDLLYLIWKALLGMQGGSSEGGSDSSDSDSGSSCSCLAPMIVRGSSSDREGVTPAEGSPTWSEAYAHILAGGLVYFISIDPAEPDVTSWISLATYAEDGIIIFGFDRENGTFWSPTSEPEGDDEGGSEGGGGPVVS